MITATTAAPISMRIAPRRVLCAAMAAMTVLVALPARAVDGPRVVMVPSAGKPPDLFAAEADFCRSEADSLTSTTPQGPTIVSSAVVGTVLGAAMGSVFSSRRHDRTAAGAVTGLIVGTASGANRSAVNEAQEQQRYDVVYAQCMVAKGNVSAPLAYRQTAATAYAVEPYAAAPPPPPTRSASPPPNTPPPASPASAVPR